MRLQPGGGVELGEGRDEDDRPIAAPGEQHAIGVDAQLEGVAHVRGARVTHGAGVGPGLTFPDEVGAPGERRAVELEALLSLIHISEPTRRTPISYAVFCLKKKKDT